VGFIDTDHIKIKGQYLGHWRLEVLDCFKQHFLTTKVRKIISVSCKANQDAIYFSLVLALVSGSKYFKNGYSLKALEGIIKPVCHEEAS